MSERPASPRNTAASLLPANWLALAPLVDAVLDAPLEKRHTVLDELCAGDADKRVELERLVMACERDAPLLDRHAAERFEHLLASAPEAPLPEVLNERYRIERELGRGGMARVYLAHDIKHARSVAVKVIRPELAASLGRDRFLREIRIAAQLHHPNIVALYDSGDANGVLYFVMPYEEGPSLRARLSDGTMLTVAECVSLLRDVARALAYAHERGIVHRDVKPDNVMLSGGAAVVTDFGIAKAVSLAQGETLLNTLTQAGAGLGTAAYMAPEQAVGDPSTDHRADIYSFGCLAYELFTGKPPFHDMPTHQIIAAHVGTAPVSITEHRADVPAGVARLVMRCLEKNPAARPQHAQEVLAALENADGDAPLPRPIRRVPTRTLLTLSTIVVLLAAGAMYLSSREWGATSASAPDELSISVLPLTNPGGDTLQRDLAEALSDDIANALFRVPGLVVKSRWGVSNYRGLRDIVPQQMARQLGVRYLVTGHFHEADGRLVVLASLIRADDNRILWSQRFDRAKSELGSIRDDITSAIGDTLQGTIGTRKRQSTTRVAARVINTDALRYNILAQSALKKRGAGFRSSVDNFQKAIAIDSLYADAYSGLSLAMALSLYLDATIPPDFNGAIRRNAERALALDPTLAQAHVALALMHRQTYQWDSASAEFQRAFQLRRADDVEPLVQWAINLNILGRHNEAVTQLRLAQRTEPASAVVSSRLSYAYYLAGKLDSALLESDKAFQNDSTNQTTLNFGSIIHLKAGHMTRARELASQATSKAPSPMGLYVLAMTGDTATAMQRLQKLESRVPPSPLRETARAFVMLGKRDTTRALDALERAAAAGEIWPLFGSVDDVVFNSVRTSARFVRLLQSVKFPSSTPEMPSRPATR